MTTENSRADALTDLLPCPFCNGTSEFDSDDSGYHWVACRSCGVSSDTARHCDDDCRERLTAAWNTRATPPVSQPAAAPIGEVTCARMGHGVVSIADCFSPELQEPGVIFMELPEQRDIGLDTGDFFPEGSRAPSDKTLAYISFANPEAIDQTIAVLQRIKAKHFPAPSPADERAAFIEAYVQTLPPENREVDPGAARRFAESVIEARGPGWQLWTAGIAYARAANETEAEGAFIDIVFDGPPSRESGRFVEVEDEHGRSFNAGEWIDRGNGLWALRIVRSPAQAPVAWKTTHPAVCVPITEDREIAEQWRAHGYQVIEFFDRPVPAMAAEAPEELPHWFEMFLTNVCELPDRNSPEGEPDAIVATLDELRNCALNAIEQCVSYAAPQPAQADARDEDAYVVKRLSEALAAVYATIVGDDQVDENDGLNVIQRCERAAQVLRLEVELYRGRADARVGLTDALRRAREELSIVEWENDPPNHVVKLFDEIDALLAAHAGEPEPRAEVTGDDASLWRYVAQHAVVVDGSTEGMVVLTIAKDADSGALELATRNAVKSLAVRTGASSC
ncbi:MULTISPECIES: Lar family restriction alleviation protein [Burkholderia cepacia complex]|uniref:Lar family restriction alleviation protein n=1 Tax=Burkholderia cepacia complex TaxID=87882 RepID=UPI001FC8C81B|nr:Lar family restriction alleviation protein [Burkholderia cenocepacia]